MARKARERAASGIYHVLLRGNNKLLFVEDADYRQFLTLLSAACAADLTEVYAYCLLPEAVHLAVKEGLRDFADTVKAVVSKYALWYNRKYARTGKLFYDRFASLPVESDAVLLDLVRYIHRLPLRFGWDEHYKYGSYDNYLKKTGLRSDAILLLLDNSPLAYRVYMERAAEGTFLTEVPKVRLTDEEVRAAIRTLLDGVDPAEVDALDEHQFRLLVRRFKRIEGVSLRQLARVLGLSKSFVERA